jgi:serine/threonine protein kinase
MPLSVGDRVGRFKLVGLLGEGGMGAVYRAEDSVLGRAVALKILHARGSGDAGAAKLLHEARAAAALNHPNAVAVFDVGEADGVAYIAMELLSGDTLRAHMGVAGVPLGKRLAWLLEVASALEAAHKRGIVHRDIKPENVFVRSDGVIKVLDFGIARRVSAPVDATATTLGGELAMSATATEAGTREIAGTPVYMAPEQLKGEGRGKRGRREESARRDGGIARRGARRVGRSARAAGAASGGAGGERRGVSERGERRAAGLWVEDVEERRGPDRVPGGHASDGVGGALRADV